MAAEDWIDWASADEYMYDDVEPSTGYEDSHYRRKPVAKGKVNKFYVGARHIAEAINAGYNDDWTHETIEEAVRHGKEIMEREGSDTTIIVQVIRVLKRKPPVKPPISVEVVK